MIWTTAKLAEETKLTHRYVRRLVRSGIINGTKVGRDWIIFEEDAQRFLEERKKLEEKAAQTSE